MRKGSRRLNYEDRQKIEKMAEQGARVIVIADTGTRSDALGAEWAVLFFYM